jgi:sigma-70-like protein
MSRLDDLPPDQRAVLSLLVRQGKSHAEIADMLGIPQQAVRDRARAALDALAGEPSEEASGAAQRQGPISAGRAPRSSTEGPSSPPPAASTAAASAPTSAMTPNAGPGFSASLPSSRRGGALLLTALVVIVVVVVILITSGGGSNKTSSTQASTTTPATTPATTTPSETKTSGATTGAATTSSTAKQGASPTVDKQIALTSPEPNSKTVGLVEVVSEGSKHAIYLAAEHLPPAPTGSFYAVWLSNSPTSSTPLGKTPTVGANGRLQAGTLLPANAGDYQKILLTRETSSKAAQPGPTVLSGAFSLGSH